MMNKNETFTEEQVTAYLNFYYVPGYLQAGKEFYYNGINDAYLFIPFNKEKFGKTELLKAFDAPGTELIPEIEFKRFKLFLARQTNSLVKDED